MQVHPFVVLTSVLFGSTLFGVIGALVAIPVAAAIQISIVEYFRFRQQTRGGGRGRRSPPAAAPPPAPTRRRRGAAPARLARRLSRRRRRR